MNKINVEWNPQARIDLSEILDYISDDNFRAARLLDDEIQNKVNRLPLHPQLYRLGRLRDTREMIVRGKYKVIYTVNATEIMVWRVLHTSRNW